MYPTLRQMYNYDNSTLTPLTDTLKWHIHPKHRTYNDDFLNELLDRCGDFGIIYATPAEFRKAVVSWVGVNKGVWIELAKTTCYLYDPIANYDRTETIEEERLVEDSGNNKYSGVGESSGSNSGEGFSEGSSNNSVNESKNASNTNKVAAYNSEDLVERNGTIESVSAENQANTSSNSRATNSESYSANNNSSGSGEYSGNKKEHFRRSVRTSGNIGVTTTQQMIEAERNSARFNLWNTIINQFEERFCILVY